MICPDLVQKWLQRSVLLLVFALFVVWQVPGTIALRNSVFATLLVLTVLLSLKDQKFSTIKYLFIRPEWLVLVLLTMWLEVSLGFAVDPALSSKELIAQWLLPIIYALMGTLLGGLDKGGDQSAGKIVQCIFWALLAQVTLHSVLDLFYWIQTREIPFRQAPVLYLPELVTVLAKGRSFKEVFTGDFGDKFSYVNNALAAFVVAELVQRIVLRKRWLPIGWPILIGSAVAVLACTYLLQFRNGNVGLLLLISFAALMSVVRLAKRLSLWKISVLVVAMIATVFLLGSALYKSDGRWQTFIETVPVAWDTEQNVSWRQRELPYPSLASEQPIDGSAYLRVAWAKEGMLLVGENPFGTGFNRNAFGDGIDSKYDMGGSFRGGHSHSGLIDFVIANGVPGLVLWLVFLGILFYAGWSAFIKGRMAVGLVLMFIVSGFFNRSLVDSNIRDHMLQQFMFLSMLIAAILGRQNPRDVVDD